MGLHANSSHWPVFLYSPQLRMIFVFSNASTYTIASTWPPGLRNLKDGTCAPFKKCQKKKSAESGSGCPVFGLALTCELGWL